MTGFVARVAGSRSRVGALSGYVTRLLTVVAHILPCWCLSAVTLQVARFSTIVALFLVTWTFLGKVAVVAASVAIHCTHVATTTTALVAADLAIFGDVTRSTTLIARTGIESVATILLAGAVTGDVPYFTTLVAVLV